MTDDDLILSRDDLDAVIFELDGVVTRTAGLHAAAWKRMLDDYLRERPARAGEDQGPFDAERDYRRYVDGKPRDKGLRHFLLARGIDLPPGDPADPPERETLAGLGNRKNQVFRELLREHGVEVHECAVALIRRLRRAGVRTAVVTASRNGDLILGQAGLGKLFEAKVDGVEAEHLGLAGKPDPDTYIEAARRLGVEPARTAVLEDANAGVAAASRGRFGLVIGVDRDGQRRALLAHGAGVVVSDLCRIQVVAPEDAAAPVPPPLDDPAQLADALADRRPALFLNYDGTLTPLVERPEDARLGEELRTLLRAAAGQMPVAVVSGRDLGDVQARVGVTEIVYAGSHGFEIRGPDLHLELAEGVDALADLAQAATELKERLAGLPGVQVERKRFAVAVHLRRADAADAARAERVVERVQEGLPRLRRGVGRQVVELRPDIDWDKGRAIAWLLTELGVDGPDWLPVYIGDDSTDEDAFRALAGRGVGILVAEQPQPSAATWRVRDPAAVAALLRHLIETERAGA